MTRAVTAIAQALPIAKLDGVTQRYKRAVALDDVTLALPSGCMVGLIGPDGVGKSTLLSMLAGARSVQTGRATVLGGDMADAGHRNAICSQIAFMPQGLGKNLYPDLSIRENIEFFGRLFGQSRSERDWRIAELFARHWLGVVRRSRGQETVRWHAAGTWLVLRTDPRSRFADPR
jgi:ribosome-dependent ATPase